MRSVLDFPKGLNRKRSRGGFTLLEALLASAISLLLLGGLYVVVELQVFTTQNSRDAIAQATLARALMDRIARDMVGSITINNPGPFRTGDLYYPGDDSGSSSSGTSTSGTGTSTGTSSGTSTGSSAGTGTGTGAGTGTGTSSAGGSSSGSTSGSSSSSSTGSSSSSSSGSSSSTTSTSTPAQVRVLFIPGVVGYQDQLTAFQAGTLRVSQVPASTSGSGSQSPTDSEGPVCDIKRVTYWVPGEGQGLARWESSQVSSPDSVNTASLPGDVENLIIAPEVRSITFSYNDGTPGYWTDFWDSRSLSYDSSTPQGPPKAVKIEVEMEGADGKTIRRYSQVVALPTANSIALGKVVDPGANSPDSGSSSSSSSSGSSSGGSTSGGSSSTGSSSKSTSGGSTSGGSKSPGTSSGSKTTGGGSSGGTKSIGGGSGSGATNSSGSSKSTGGSSGRSK